MEENRREEQLRIESNCIEMVKRGNAEAYSTIVNTYMKKAYFIALSFVKTEQDALDVSQEAFIKAFRYIKKFKIGSKFFPWFYRILKNLCLDWIKKGKKSDTIPLENVNPSTYPEIAEELKINLWKGIDKLPSDQREILLLRYFQGYSYREISQLLDKPLGSVMSSLYYAKKNLRSKMEKYLK